MIRKNLASYINLGQKIEKELNKAGINTIEELIAMGSEEAFIKLHTIDKTSCIHKLYALEGAIQGIRWHDLPQQKKDELKIFFNLITKNK